MAVLRKMLLEAPAALRILAALLVLLVPVASTLAAGTFIWDQLGGDYLWSNEDNWTAPATCTADCYPHTTDDDAVIDEYGHSSMVLDDDYTIDDMTISADVLLAIQGEGYELSCDSIVIDIDSEVRVWDQVTLIARKSNDP